MAYLRVGPTGPTGPTGPAGSALVEVSVAVPPWQVKTITADYTLEADDNMTLLDFPDHYNLFLNPGACPVGTVVVLVVSPSITHDGAVVPAPGVKLNGYDGSDQFAARGLTPGLMFLAQIETDVWRMGYMPTS